MTPHAAVALVLTYGPHVLGACATAAYISYNVLPRGDPPAGGWRRAFWLAREFTLLLSRYETMGGFKVFGAAEMTPAASIRAATPVPVLFPPKAPGPPVLPPPIPREEPVSSPPPRSHLAE